MSWPSFCPPCEMGRHAQHDRGTTTPGLIGGTYCPCEGCEVVDYRIDNDSGLDLPVVKRFAVAAPERHQETTDD